MGTAAVAAGLSAFTAGFLGFLAAPLVRNTLAVCGTATFTGDLSLPFGTHGCKSTIRFFGLVLCVLILCHILGVLYDE